jgi:soluble lytic murein transglycosylase-like protein
VLDVENVDPDLLTTYAGLLLRDLLDRFQGDVAKAVGAYNGGVSNPNLRYAAGVQMVADYARRVIERATELNEATISNTSIDHRMIQAEAGLGPQ